MSPGARTSRAGTHCLSSGPYPSQSTKYCNPLPRQRDRNRRSDGVERPTVEEAGGWGRRNQGYQGAIPDRFDPGDMEGGVDAHRAWELEPDRHRVYDLLDGEGSDKPGGQFPALHV